MCQSGKTYMIGNSQTNPDVNVRVINQFHLPFVVFCVVDETEQNLKDLLLLYISET